MVVVLPEAYIPEEDHVMKDVQPSEDDGEDFDLQI